MARVNHSVSGELNWQFPERPPRRVRHSSQGFSLLELLTVAATISLLAGLMFPAAGRAKRQAQSAQCINNLRQLGIALNIYTGESDSYPLATQNGITGSWQIPLRASTSASTMCCPVPNAASTNFAQIFNWTEPTINPHYGYNIMGAAYRGSPPFNPGLGGDVDLNTGARTATPVNRVLNPAQMITIGDSITFINVFFGPQPQSNIPNQIYITFPYPVPHFAFAGVGDWHNMGANMLFADCHVQFALQSYWIAATDESRRLWNSDNKPHEEWW